MYRINVEMLGSDATEAQARKMVDILQDMGYDVEFTADCGCINYGSDDEIPDDVWNEVLEQL